MRLSPIAQLAERTAVNRKVAGSNPSGSGYVFPIGLVFLRMHDAWAESLKKGDPAACFGLVVNAAWPPPDAVRVPYEAFASALRSAHPSVASLSYLYPFAALHVTVATFHAFTNGARASEEQGRLLAAWSRVLRLARHRPEWPVAGSRMLLRLKEISLLSSAGIFLYEDSSGVMDSLRAAIRGAVNDEHANLVSEGIDPDTLKVPGIIHRYSLNPPFWFGAAASSELTGST